MTYAENLKDPRWQKRRLELLQAADWTCKECGSKTETLHVHHGYYKRNTCPWDYPDEVMHILCEDCHARAGIILESIHEAVGKLRLSDLRSVQSILGTEDTPEDNVPARLGIFSILSNTSASIGKPPPSTERPAAYFWLLEMMLEDSSDAAVYWFAEKQRRASA